MTLTWLPRLPMPMRKLSGLISRWMKLREWMYSMREICKRHDEDDPISKREWQRRTDENTYQLISEEQDSLEAELAVAEVEKILERGTEEIDDHGVVVALGAEPTDEGHANTTSERLVDLGFILELGVFGLD